VAETTAPEEYNVSLSTLAVSSAAKIKSLLISSFLATAICHFRRITNPITGTTTQTTTRTRLENPRSPVTRIYLTPLYIQLNNLNRYITTAHGSNRCRRSLTGEATWKIINVIILCLIGRLRLRGITLRLD